MVVTVIVLLFTASAATVFIQLIQTSDAVDARVEAVSNARFLLDTLSEDLSQATLSPTIDRNDLFRLAHVPLAYGDLVDNDSDGAVDEEAADGQDNDGDWTLTEDRDYLGNFGAIIIRERGLNNPDLGDANIDEDVVFNSDVMTFWIPGDGTTVLRREVTYRIDTFEGEDNVAIREVRSILSGGGETTEIGPLAFNVLSLNFLAWNHRGAAPTWDEAWVSGIVPLSAPAAPVAVYADVTVFAESTELKLPPTRGMQTARLATMINLESVLSSPLYPRGS